MTRKIRIEYFLVVSANVDGSSIDNLFHLENLILKAEKIGLKDRTYTYYQEEARLDKSIYNKYWDYWYLNFIRLRQTKLPVKATINTESVPLLLSQNEYIGEEVTAVYDVENHILALQRNRDSLSATGIEQYLTQLNGSPDTGIYLRPIAMKGLNNKIRNSKVYRKLTMRFASASEIKKKGLADSSFAKLLEYFGSFNAKTATLILSMGNDKKGTLDLDTITDTISDIYNTEGIVTGAEINLKYSEYDPVDTIDLFAMKYHDFITIKIEKLEPMDYLNIANEISIKYQASKENILKTLQK